MCRSDLLLLDEPTNHLDLDAVLWLEDWLQRYPGHAAADHARPRLPRRASSSAIVHVDEQQAQRLHRQLLRVRARSAPQQLALQQATYAKQQRQIAHLQAFIDRFRAKATKAKQAQSRIKTLEKMERIAAAHVDTPVRVRVRAAGARSRASSSGSRTRRSATASDAGASRRRVERARRATRIGLLGPNGAGKSTLLKALAGDLAARRRASCIVAQGLRIGYFAQHQVEQLRLDAVAAVAPAATRSGGARAGAARLPRRLRLPRRHGRRSRSASFSGGEKARLALALIVLAAAATCCCSTSRPTTSTSRCARRSPRRCRTSRARSSSSRTTATCSRATTDQLLARRRRRASRRSTATSTTTATGCCARGARDGAPTTRRGRRAPTARREARRGAGAAEARRRARSRSSRSRRSSRPRCARSRTRSASRRLARDARGLRGRREGAAQARDRARGRDHLGARAPRGRVARGRRGARQAIDASG